MYTNLLNRQVKRYLKEGILITPEWEEFLKAVNNSYEHYERDHFLGKQSLEISSGELKQLIEEIGDKEARIRAILGATSDGLVVINEKQEIELCNESAANFLGYADIEGLIGKDASSLKFRAPDKYWEDQFGVTEISSLSDIFTKEGRNLYQLVTTQPGGVDLFIELSVSELKLRGDKKLTICVLRDITLRKQSERKIRLRHEITRMLLGASSLQDVMPSVLSVLCDSLDWDVAVLWLREKQGGNLQPLHFSEIKPVVALEDFKDEITKIKLSIDDENLILNNCRNNPQYYAKEIDDLVFKNFIERFGVRCHIAFPIFFKDKLFGLLEFFAFSEHHFDEQLVKVSQDICSEIYMFLERQESVQREHDLQRQLLVAARQAGMMQVATSVLHNVGNILNSVNISAHMIQESVFSQGFENFNKVAVLIKQHESDLIDYITKDERGKNLPEYLVALSDWIQAEQAKLRSELKQLIGNIEDIKNVIKRQQKMSLVIGLREKFMITKLLDDVIAMKSQQISKHEIQLKTDYRFTSEIELDRVMLFQILENLVGNAIDSLKKKDIPRRLVIETERNDENILYIRIIDNGGGIEEKNLESLFSFGFTTKGAEGHGYGLHSSALLVKEMGGKISVKSEGLGKGAMFIVELPLSPRSSERKQSLI